MFTTTSRADTLSPLAAHRVAMRGVTPKLAFTGGDFTRWQRKARTALRSLLNVPQNDHNPLRVRRIWARETDLGRIEKIVFRAEPGADIPAYFCIPYAAQPPYRTFICLQGHSTGMHNSIAVDRENEHTPIDVPGDRDVALGCMRQGIAALCIEQRSLGIRGERLQKAVCSHSSCHDSANRALLLGRTLIGERVFDVDRAIDYLASRGDVDMQQIGILGNSGGGTTSFYAAALLPRLACAIPSCAFASYWDSIGTIYHCACNYVPRILEHFDMGDLAGLIAPKPLVIVSGKTDDIFPLASARKQFRQTRRIYRAAGTPAHCAHIIGPEGHRFYANLAWAAMEKMMGKHCL